MLSNLIPNISRHFLYSVLKHDYDSGMEIINTIVSLPPEQVGEFLASFAGGLDGMFSKFEVDLRGYEKVRDGVVSYLQNPNDSEGMEGLN